MEVGLRWPAVAEKHWDTTHLRHALVHYIPINIPQFKDEQLTFEDQIQNQIGTPNPTNDQS